MTRLSKHQNKQFFTQLLVYSVIVIAFLVFLVTFGFKLLISGSLLINQLANNTRSKQNSSNAATSLTSLTIDPPATATNSAHLVVSGETVNFDIVEIYLNGEKVNEAPVTNDSFSSEIAGLEKGDNSLYFIAKSKKSSETKRSSQFTVTYKSDKPKLEISNPQDGSKVNKQDLTISGKTDKETYVKINDQPVVVNADGSFTASYKLNDGDNTLTIIAEDIVGNQEQKVLKVTYAKDD